MYISVLVVDDSRPVAEGFGGKLNRFAAEHFSIEANVEVLCDSDEAVQRLSDVTKPSLDLLFTDIDFAGGDNPDKAGVALARYLKRSAPELPVVGYSGRFDNDDLGEIDREIFDSWWPKGGSVNRLNDIARDALERAIAYHQRRGKDRDKMRRVRSTRNGGDESKVVTPKTDEEFGSDGYKKKVIEPSSTKILKEPFAVWVRESSAGVELEVVGCSALFTWGDSYEEAEENLLALIDDIKGILNDPEESFSASLLSAKKFVEIVTGSRGPTKGE